MFEKIIIFFLINLYFNLLVITCYSIEAIYEATEPNQNISIFRSFCNITNLEIDGKSVNIHSDDRYHYFYYNIFEKAGRHIMHISIDLLECDYLAAFFDYVINLVSVKFTDEFKNNKIFSTSSLFAGCSNLTSIDISNLNTEYVRNMDSMFSNCEKMNSINLSNFNTKNVTSMQRMFIGCSSLTSIDLSKFDTSKVTRIEGMFWG